MTNPSVDVSALLAWYDQSSRELPWRFKNGQPSDPYRVWISEIMLQQTTVATVIPYFDAFMRRWPTLQDLAAASLDEVLHGWQGLGYYSRARNLHRCAQEVAWNRNGVFPSTEKELLQLPGIGPYTAAAVAAIAFHQPTAAMDGNILRVFSRTHAREEQGLPLKEAVHRISSSLVPLARPGDYTQALMDLGATVCRPRQPLCPQCPWQSSCQAFIQNKVSDFPRLPPKKPLPFRYGLVFWAQRPDGAILLEKRATKGLLGGLMSFPSTPWEAGVPSDANTTFPLFGNWQRLPEEVVHTFTHFKLFLTVWTGEIALENAEGVWVKPEAFQEYAFSTLMKKVTRYVLAFSNPCV